MYLYRCREHSPAWKKTWHHYVLLRKTLQNFSHSSHYNDVIMDTIASQITSFTIVHPTVYSDADQRKHQSSASLAFVRGTHRGPVNSPHKWPVARKCFHLMTSSCVEAVKSSGPKDAIWRHRWRSTSVQVMVCCLTAQTSTWINVY